MLNVYGTFIMRKIEVLHTGTLYCRTKKRNFLFVMEVKMLAASQYRPEELVPVTDH